MDSRTVAKAKLFLHGRSQAVRLPKEFRFEGTEVYVRRVGEDVVLSTKAKASMRSLVEALEAFEPGFAMLRQEPAGIDARTPLVVRKQSA